MLNMTLTPKRVRLLAGLVLALLIASGCGNMREQPKYHDPYDESLLGGSAARELSEGAVPVGFDGSDEYLYTGFVDGSLGDGFPITIDEETLALGQRLYNGFCSPCHGYDADGSGVVTQEGYPIPAPASHHQDRLREAPDGYYFDVITNGIGLMYSYGGRLEVEERWAVIAYVRALQYSQYAPYDELPLNLQDELDN